MNSNSPHQLALVLRDWRRGDKNALDKLMPLFYTGPRQLAHRYMLRERAGPTLQTTTLVNDACLRVMMHEWNLAKAWLLHHLKRGVK